MIATNIGVKHVYKHREPNGAVDILLSDHYIHAPTVNKLDPENHLEYLGEFPVQSVNSKSHQPQEFEEDKCPFCEFTTGIKQVMSEHVYKAHPVQSLFSTKGKGD